MDLALFCCDDRHLLRLSSDGYSSWDARSDDTKDPVISGKSKRHAKGLFKRVDPPNSTASDVAGINDLGEVDAQANANNVTNDYVGVPHK